MDFQHGRVSCHEADRARARGAAVAYRERLETLQWFYNEELYALRLRLGMVWDGVRVQVDKHDQVCGVIEARPHRGEQP